MRTWTQKQERQLLELPQNPQDVWLADRRTLSGLVDGAPVAATLWLEAATGMVRAFDVTPAANGDLGPWVESMLDAMLHPVLGTVPGRPGVIALSAPAVLAALREPLARLGVRAVPLEDSEGLDPIFANLQSFVSSEGYEYLSRRGVKPAQVDELFHAAGRLWEAAPWDRLDNLDLLELRGLARSPLYCTVMGSGGLEQGVLVYLDARGVKAAARDDVEAMTRCQALSLTFASPEEAGPAVLMEAEEHGWPLMEDEEGEVYVPMALRIGGRGNPVPGPADLALLCDVLAVVEACADQCPTEVSVPGGRVVRVLHRSLYDVACV
ncbi:MAG: hypothetical protein AB1758_18655 [Candidatus Eremiobacterota bacterium]